MSDNLFDQLFELFQSPGPVNWKLAAEVMRSVAGPAEPIEPRVAEEYQELTLAAQLRVEDHTPLRVAATDLDPLDARAWAEANQQSFRYVIEPLAGKLTIFGGDDAANPFAAMLAPLGPAILGMQAGTMVGLMSRTVLGQFDTGLPALDTDRRMLVVPNVEAFAAEHGLDHQQVRLWAAFHEVVHHAALDAPGVRASVVEKVTGFFDSVRYDAGDLTSKLETIEDPAELQSLLGEGPGGFAKLLGAEHDPQRLAELQALIAFLDGYGDHLVRVAGASLLPQLDAIETAYRDRRAQPSEAEQILDQLAGLTLERHRAADATLFCSEIERRWSAEALRTVWEDPANFPTLAELTDPVGWAARVLLDEDLDEMGLADLDWNVDGDKTDEDEDE